ncbi:hypothetical protein F4813DRAFT_387861 [Daldinia decipiens]|uniref:uncharacterized protein n=1 Tax=Daldinia decipiens TaxID=326647 RepID=UPI0020C2CF4E|nr:uncharacterized protein F4813DRAFT_387861 [Daldinia decipiens]KAI1659152.1 hypothetical protein F4813DRAFT_387861 [Daldinia decipiens]
MPNLNAPDTPRRQQLIRRSHSVGSAPLQSEFEFEANTTNASDENKEDAHTRESNTTPIIMREITYYGHMNIMPQVGIVQGVGCNVLNQEGSSPSIPSLVFVSFIVSALSFLLSKLLG